MKLWILLLAVAVSTEETPGQNSCVERYPGIPGNPGHNGIPGRDGRDGTKGEKGDTGDPGNPGKSGRDGINGNKGEPGADGRVEEKGNKGDKGERGWPGKFGPKGIPGPVGDKGQQGELGPQGRKGIKGDLGPIGPKGQKGEIGIQGEIGLKGPIGPKGHVGPKGEIGGPGPKGSKGNQGERGWKGSQGEKGNLGSTPVIARSAFSVGLTAKFPPLNVPIKFDKVLYNSFDHYSTETGVFTCQIPGVYYFTYHITVFSRNMRVALVKNEHRMLHTADMYQGAEDQASGGIVLELQKGDRIWLQSYGGETFNGLYADPDDDTIFSGFLLFSTSEAPASASSSI
ncbi:LOW QUALITY PROTEIN: complement C1q and tumor necrosis factor-related protein 9A-like [Pantherophis guttatus]|uniref:LOW QUALITY PROTEIN: complement C1q and tumor necrosis factor-related protein 9A-like n=1 Tax=Pantherophis guttatus TaxID=94885 RepID=A0A6P9B4Y6_PANGU|nr:LOW QUALITY PROTEIN: complement C1q and tumor necrosis factor-related protein 9A-like [Pantherophis guttatus]